MAKKKSRANARNKASASTKSPLHSNGDAAPSSSTASGPETSSSSQPVQGLDTTLPHTSPPVINSPAPQEVVAFEDTPPLTVSRSDNVLEANSGVDELRNSSGVHDPQSNSNVHDTQTNSSVHSPQSKSSDKGKAVLESELIDAVPPKSVVSPIPEPLIETRETLTATANQDHHLQTKQEIGLVSPKSTSTPNIVESSSSYERRVSTTSDDHVDEQTPLSPGRYLPERGSPRRYEEDNDDYYHNEHSPLIQTSSRDSGSDVRVEGMPHQSSYGNRLHEPQRVETWNDWSIQNGLHPRTWERQTYFKALLLSSLVTLIILSLTVFRVQDHIKDVLRYIDGHKRIGALLFIASYTVACTLFLPASLWTVGAGFLFKPFPLALAIVLAGDVFAAVWSFIFGRYVFYGWVKSMMSSHPKFNALDQVIKDDGWKIVVMLRLTPIPFNLITYFFSITSIRLWTVVWATCLGVLPGSCIGIWIGTLLKGLSGIDNPELETKNFVILVMNGILVVCSILALSMFGKRSLRKAMKRLERHQAISDHENVEVVVEGVATVIRELEDYAHVPPHLRSNTIDQLAAEEEGLEYYQNGDQRLLLNQDRAHGTSAYSPAETAGIRERVPSPSPHHIHGHPRRDVGSSGFTRGEKIMFILISIVAVVTVCVCVPLYFHYSQEDE